MRICCQVFFLAVVLSGSGAGAVTDDFARYQEILDRKPFGEPPPDPSMMPTNVVQNEADLFTKTLKMVAIRLDQNGRVRVGFINKAAANKSYYLRAGETSPDGIELVDADFELESALLKKDSRSGWIYMGTSPNKALSEPTKGVPAPTAARVSSTQMAQAVQQKRVSLYADLLRKRKESQDAKANKTEVVPGIDSKAASDKISGEQLEKHLKEYQLDAIRKGLPPLPIPLTKEMDDQLVSEGVLPPLQNAQ